ncbi:MAG: hypothetical protein ACYTEX_24480, partial [Planctomycetota bacterium]
MKANTNELSRADWSSVLVLTCCLGLIPAFVQAQVISEHKDRGTAKLLFHPEFDAGSGLTPEEQAYAYLSASHNRFGLPQDLSNLQLAAVKHSLVGTHFHFQQYVHGIAVENAQIIISLKDEDGEILTVFNNTYPQEAPKAVLKTITDEDALDIAWNHLRVHGELISLPTVELIYVPEAEGFRLIYRTQINVQAPFGYWEHRIDAGTGAILAVRETSIPRIKREQQVDLDFDSYRGSIFPRDGTTARLVQQQAQDERKRQVVTQTTVNGTADVFDPDPRTTLMDANMEDTDPDANFTAAYLNRTLRDITLHSGTYSLDGPWVRIVNIEAPNTAPSTTTDGNWTARRGNNAFNDVMTYFHIDQNQRYIQSLGFTGGAGIQDGRIDADSDGVNGADDSHYVPSTNIVAFGHGCVDDNEDADVILHEYGHAIQHDINPNWSGGDTGAMGEGFGDYWAGSYSYSTTNGPSFHPEWAFTWDGHNNCWEGRVMNRLTYEYDPHSTYPAHAWVNGVYGDELWGTPLFQAFLDLIGLGRPRTEMDRIVLQSHFGLGANLTMPDLAAATVTAAQLLYPAGPHALVYARHFGHHNILTTYVDGSWLGTENGTIQNPFNTISEGVSAVTAGARLSVKGGSYTGAGNVPITITKA